MSSSGALGWLRSACQTVRHFPSPREASWSVYTVAALTGGLSILAQRVWDRYLSRADYCQAVIDALDAGEIPVWEGEPESP